MGTAYKTNHRKGNLSIELKDGYLYISATLKNEDKDDGTLHLFIDTRQQTVIENKQMIAIED